MGKPIKPKSDDTREKILVASVKRFSKFGYRRTSINDVAEAAGLARATVYLYWKKKEDLFVAGLERFNVQGRRLAETAAAKKGSAAKRIENSPASGLIEATPPPAAARSWRVVEGSLCRSRQNIMNIRQSNHSL